MSIQNIYSANMKSFKFLWIGFLTTIVLFIASPVIAQEEVKDKNEDITTYDKLKVFSEILSLGQTLILPSTQDNLRPLFCNCI